MIKEPSLYHWTGPVRAGLLSTSHCMYWGPDPAMIFVMFWMLVIRGASVKLNGNFYLLKE